MIADDYYQIKQEADKIKRKIDRIQNTIELKNNSIQNIVVAFVVAIFYLYLLLKIYKKFPIQIIVSPHLFEKQVLLQLKIMIGLIKLDMILRLKFNLILPMALIVLNFFVMM
jgi:hypothetical protein